MNRQTETKTIKQKAQMLRNKVSKFAVCFAPARLFARNRRGVSAVVSNLILIAAVITLGLVALGFARSTSIGYQTDYARSVGEDISKLKESLTFEYVHHAGNSLEAYVLNSGTTNVTIAGVSVNGSPATLQSITPMDGGSAITVVEKGMSVKITLDISGVTINGNGENTIKINSGSNLNYAYAF